MVKYVVFDLDGTLLDTLQDLAAAGNHALSAMGLPTHPVARYRMMVGNGIPKLVERMLPPGHRGSATRQVALELFNGYYTQHMQDLTSPYPGIVPLLENLGKNGVRMGVASNKSDAYARPMVEDYFPHVFHSVVGLREGANPKPDPAAVFYVMAELGATTAGTLFVGDSNVDMQTARNAGLPGIGVLWGFRDEAELLAEGARQVVATPEALQQLILSPPPGLLPE